jgi:hypothetical protein
VSKEEIIPIFMSAASFLDIPASQNLALSIFYFMHMKNKTYISSSNAIKNREQKLNSQHSQYMQAMELCVHRTFQNRSDMLVMHKIVKK